jgi:hypothetical protein
MANAIPYNPRRRAPWAIAGASARSPEFLCPICAEGVFGDGGLTGSHCEHVLLVQDRVGGIYCRDGSTQALAIEAFLEAERLGGSTMDALQRRMGPGVVFYELLDPAPGSGALEVLTIVVDLDRAA